MVGLALGGLLRITIASTRARATARLAGRLLGGGGAAPHAGAFLPAARKSP